MSLHETGIRPLIDEYLKKKEAEERDYGEYWSASSAGYCMRLNILKRLKIPPVPEIAEDRARTIRVFEAGHIFHEWIQRITKDAGISIAQEVELQDEDLMVRGHFDDLVLVGGPIVNEDGTAGMEERNLILYDYKTQNSQAFNYKRPEMGHSHKMQLGTYMYMLRKYTGKDITTDIPMNLETLTEARILKISKDDLRLHEEQMFWTPDLEKEVVGYWNTLNGYWKRKVLPRCTCKEYEGFMGKRSSKGKIYNDYFLNDEPCSGEYIKMHSELMKGWTL